MPVYLYQAKDQAGTTINSSIDATSQDAAIEQLQQKNYIILSIREKVSLQWTSQLLKILNRVRAKDITFFARQLSVMINANVPVVRALHTISTQTNNPYFQTVINSVAGMVDGGTKLSVAMSRYPAIFDQFFVQMIRSGETTGRLDEVLAYLATQKEQDYDVRNRIFGALIYPAVIVTVMIILAIVMLIFVIPRLTDIITQSGGDIPFATRMLLAASGFMSNYWWLLLLFVMLFVGAMYVYSRTPQGKYYIDVIRLRMPVFGPLYQKIALTRFCISLSNLLSSGVPVIKSLEISGDVVSNQVINELVKKTIIEVESGHSVASIFSESKYIPAILPQMMTIGEETGQLDEVLIKLARFYTKEVEAAIAVLTSLIEPLIIILLGIGAAILVTGILTPIYSISNSIA